MRFFSSFTLLATLLSLSAAAPTSRTELPRKNDTLPDAESIFEDGVTVGQPVVISYSAPEIDEPATIVLVRGKGSKQSPVGTITTSATGGVYTWTPALSLLAGPNYAFEIEQSEQSSVSPLFRLKKPAAPKVSIAGDHAGPVERDIILPSVSLLSLAALSATPAAAPSFDASGLPVSSGAPNFFTGAASPLASVVGAVQSASPDVPFTLPNSLPSALPNIPSALSALPGALTQLPLSELPLPTSLLANTFPSSTRSPLPTATHHIKLHKPSNGTSTSASMFKSPSFVRSALPKVTGDLTAPPRNGTTFVSPSLTQNVVPSTSLAMSTQVVATSTQTGGAAAAALPTGAIGSGVSVVMGVIAVLIVL